MTSHPLQSFREGRFSAAPVQRDGKKRHMIEKQRWPQVFGLTHGELLMEQHVDGQREAGIVKCWLLMYCIWVLGGHFDQEARSSVSGLRN